MVSYSFQFSVPKSQNGQNLVLELGNINSHRSMKRLVKGSYVTRDCSKISRVMCDCAQLIHVIRDEIKECDAWFATSEGRDAWFIY